MTEEQTIAAFRKMWEGDRDLFILTYQTNAEMFCLRDDYEQWVESVRDILIKVIGFVPNEISEKLNFYLVVHRQNRKGTKKCMTTTT
jgi:hypothetical protein